DSLDGFLCPVAQQVRIETVFGKSHKGEFPDRRVYAEKLDRFDDLVLTRGEQEELHGEVFRSAILTLEGIDCIPCRENNLFLPSNSIGTQELKINPLKRSSQFRQDLL